MLTEGLITNWIKCQLARYIRGIFEVLITQFLPVCVCVCVGGGGGGGGGGSEYGKMSGWDKAERGERRKLD